MGDYYKRNAGVAVMEASNSAAGMAKRRKIVDDSSKQLRRESSSTTIDHHHDPPLPVSSPSTTKLDNEAAATMTPAAADAGSPSFCSDPKSPAPASCCSSNESSHLDVSLPIVDLEVAKSSETVDSTSINNTKNYFSSETTPSSELCGDSEENGSPAASNQRRSPAGKAPPRDEIEEFFAMAEKSEQKRFTEKYNFDIVNDTPLEGRYQWVCLKPSN
ncbi:Cyclin-dependent kinase inhibitor [Parasponia andersonii]|uniref:Cyclin-dependent kinase inhibitor n=1 Tax=Parasponia andersonii TaxID=3476 RepID=A0A2P5D742_PARAD|nr:Cyclin-dependent kinase inhibitor [Parasponia andersonii]